MIILRLNKQKGLKLQFKSRKSEVRSPKPEEKPDTSKLLTSDSLLLILRTLYFELRTVLLASDFGLRTSDLTPNDQTN